MCYWPHPLEMSYLCHYVETSLHSAHGKVISGIVEDVKLRQSPIPTYGRENLNQVTAIVWTLKV